MKSVLTELEIFIYLYIIYIFLQMSINFLYYRKPKQVKNFYNLGYKEKYN